MRVSLPLAVSLASAAAAAAQPQFRIQTNVVEVDVRVTDARGEFVHGLTAGDFHLIDNGRERPIVGAEMIDLGPPEPIGTAAESDVSSNAAADQRRRLYLLVLDDLQTHPLRSETVKAAARLFVERSLGPADRAAVVVTSGRQGPSQEFTNNRQRLLDAIDRFQGQKLPRPAPSTSPGTTAPPDSRRAPATLDRLQPLSPAYDQEGFDALTMLSRVEGWATWLSGLTTSRKALLLISEGIAFDTTDVFARVNASLVENAIRDTISAAARNNVAIYAIDPRGLPAGRQGDVPTTLVPDEEFFSMETMRARMTLRALAGATGGFAFTNSNDFAGAFARIVQESSAYYLIGFSPESMDQRVHNIVVRVNRPGLKVRFRPTYAAARSTRAAISIDSRLAAAIARPLPVAGLAIRMTAAPFRSEKSRTVMLATAEVEGATGAARELSFRVAAVAKDGHVSAVRSFAVTARDAAPVRVVCELALRPGEYQIRFAAVGASSDLEGSVYRDVVVPNLAPRPLSASGPFLASSLREWTAFAPADLGTRLEAVPTASRSFTPADQLTVLTFVHADARRTADVVVSADVTDADGRRWLADTRTLAATSRGAFVLPIALASFAPNDYIIRLRISGRSASATPIVQQIGFTVTPAKAH